MSSPAAGWAMPVWELACMPVERNIRRNQSPKQVARNCAGLWWKLPAPKAAVRSDPYWKAQFIRLKKRMYVNKAIVAIARRLLVSIWYILTNREPYRHFDEETIAYKMLIWAQASGDGT